MGTVFGLIPFLSVLLLYVNSTNSPDTTATPSQLDLNVTQPRTAGVNLTSSRSLAINVTQVTKLSAEAANFISTKDLNMTRFGSDSTSTSAIKSEYLTVSELTTKITNKITSTELPQVSLSSITIPNLKMNTTINTDNAEGYLPNGWDKFCRLKNADNFILSYSCDIKHIHSGKWIFSILRSHIASKSAKYRFDIVCDNGVNISLPWPMKAKNLIYINVVNCVASHFLADANNELLGTFPDELEVMKLIDVECVSFAEKLIEITANISNIQEDYDCGNDMSVRISVFRNISYKFIIPNNFDTLRALGEATKIFQNYRNFKHVCNYQNLEHIDNSISSTKSRFFMEMVTENTMFPALKFCNISAINMDSIPAEIKRWWLYFEKLSLLDMSHNNIKEIDFDETADAWDIPELTMNISYNRITEIVAKDVHRLATMKKLYIIFTHNPINCSCTHVMKELLTLVKDDDLWLQPGYTRYSYVRDMSCGHPIIRKGVSLKDLTVEDLDCEKELIDNTSVEAIVILSVLSLIVITSLILLLRFRKEIRILAYTRFKIILPCQPNEKYLNKRFDAFVSYCSQDSDWVDNVFDSDMTEFSSMKQFRFCMHHKHFIPGKPIFENVMDSVESSRHTIIILSRNFLKSHFCIFEFQQAFRQSIIERKRHLLIIMMEDIPVSELPNDLKRCLKTFTFIRRDDMIFIDRLVYSLSYKGQRRNNNVKDNIVPLYVNVRY